MRTLLSLISIVLLSSCTSKLVFKNPLPKSGKMVHQLPENLEGIYYSGEENNYQSIQHIGKNHWQVFEFTGIHKDSMSTYIKSLESDSIKAELRGELMILKHLPSNTSKITNTYTLDGDYYFSPKTPFLEIDLENGIAIDEFDTLKDLELIVKNIGEEYFLNIKKADGWYIMWFNQKSNDIFVHSSIITSDDFNQRLEQYSKDITPIKKLSDNRNNTFLAAPSDEEFFQLKDEKDLFFKAKWTRVNKQKETVGNNCNSSNWKLLMGGIILFLVIIIGFLRRKK